MLASNIDEVIDILDDMVAVSQRNNCPMGYFPVLYKKVTLAIHAAIKNGEFDDAERMERLNVVFANRYFSAYILYKQGKQPPVSWNSAFSASDSFWPIVLQHLLLSINAHINFDLGIAAAQVAPGNEIESLKDDFYRINQILFNLIEGFQQELNRVSPVLGVFNSLAGKIDTKLAISSLFRIRNSAWDFAVVFAKSDEATQREMLKHRDEQTASLASHILQPMFILSAMARFIRVFEWRSKTENIFMLQGL